MSGIHVRTARRIFNQIIEAEEFKQQLMHEIYKEGKAIQFLAVAAKYNPPGALEGGAAGGINIQINTMVDRDSPDKEPVKISIMPPTEEEDDGL